MAFFVGPCNQWTHEKTFNGLLRIYQCPNECDTRYELLIFVGSEKIGRRMEHSCCRRCFDKHWKPAGGRVIAEK